MRIHLGTTLLLLTCALTPRVTPAQQLPPGVLALQADDITWQESPVGWRMAELYGDMTSNAYSVVRLRMQPDWDAPPHTHQRTELEVVRVQSGTMYLAFGGELTREAAVAYGPGSFIVYPAGTTSRMFTGDEEVIVEVTHLPIG